MYLKWAKKSIIFLIIKKYCFFSFLNFMKNLLKTGQAVDDFQIFNHFKSLGDHKYKDRFKFERIPPVPARLERETTHLP